MLIIENLNSLLKFFTLKMIQNHIQPHYINLSPEFYETCVWDVLQYLCFCVLGGLLGTGGVTVCPGVLQHAI